MKRELILQAGSEALAQGGIAELDLTAIAKSVGLKPTSLRYYFKNREDLAEAVYLRRLDELNCILDAAECKGSLPKIIGCIFDSELGKIADYWAGKSGRPVQLGELRTIAFERRQRIGAKFFELLQRIGSLLERHGATASASTHHAPALLLLENLFWIPAWIDHYRPWEFDSVSDQLTRLVCGGLANRDVAQDWQILAEIEPDLQEETIDPAAFLRTATRLICRRGYRGTSIDAIAAELGVTKGSFYHHNRIKETLVEQCFAASYGRIGEFQRRSAIRSEEPLNRIATVIASIIARQLAQEAPILRASALPGLPAGIRMTVIDGAKPVVRWFVSEIARAQAEGAIPAIDPYVAAQFISIGANATFDLARFHRDDPSGPSVEGCLNMLLYGIAV